MIKKIVVYLLIAASLPIFASCGESAEAVSEVISSEASAESSEAVSEEAEVTFSITEDFTVYCTDKQKYLDAYGEINYYYRQKYGKRATFVDEIGEKTIIIGECDFTASYFQNLHQSDGFYYVMDENTVIIGGGSPSAVRKATQLFGEYAFGKDSIITVGCYFLNKQEFDISSLKINGVLYSDYTIVYTEDSLKSCADEINNGFFNSVSTEKAVVSDKASASNNIIIRKSNAASEFEYRIYAENGNIVLESPAYEGIQRAAKTLYDDFTEGLTGDVDLEITEEPYKNYYFYGATVTFVNQSITSARAENGLVLKETEETAVTDGVVYKILHYEDRDGLPVVAYVLICEPGTVSPVCGLPYGATSISSTRQDVLNMAKANENTFGIDICCAINGDLYHIDTDNHPCGYNYKNGVMLSQAEDPSIEFFAVMKDGSYFCGTMDEVADPTQIKEAVGGRYMLLRDGEFTDLGYGDDFGSIRHPRSAIGYDDDGRLYVMVVDGRQPTISNGASLPDLAIMFKQLGATNAVNIDGGGSSTFVVKNYETGKFSCLNSPSDGNLRPSINSFEVVLKED